MCLNVKIQRILVTYRLGWAWHSKTRKAFLSVVRDGEGCIVDTRHSYFGGFRFELRSGQWIFSVFRRFGLKNSTLKHRPTASYIRSDSTGPRKPLSQRGTARRDSALEWPKAVQWPLYTVLLRKPEGKIYASVRG